MKLNEYTLKYRKDGKLGEVKFVCDPRGLASKMQSFSLKILRWFGSQRKPSPLKSGPKNKGGADHERKRNKKGFKPFG